MKSATAAASQEGPGPTPESGLAPGGGQLPPLPPQAAAYDGVPAQIAAGRQYFVWYNCNGCHFNGGGGTGPALMDDKWIYGGRIDQIYHSIADGRPNGMPTWRDKIPAGQIWQIAAYVRSLSQPGQRQQNGYPKTPLEAATLGDPHLTPRTVQGTYEDLPKPAG
jgi:cytochrome c oxidase cbb3-type subunit 3